MEEHLKGNNLALDGMKYMLGKKISFDAKTELTDDAKANEILRGTYRKGFEVPDKVG